MEGRKRKDMPGGKRRLKEKNTTHLADGGRPVRLVLDLKPRVYPPSFFLYLYASPLPRPASRPPWRPFPLREDFSRRAVAIVFAPLLRALPATVPVVAMYVSRDLYLPSRHTELSSNWLDAFPSPLRFAQLKMSPPLSSRNKGVNCKVQR